MRARAFGQKILLIALFVSLTSCGFLLQREPGIGKPVKWSKLNAWQQDDLTQSWQGFLSQCSKLAKQASWVSVCEAALSVDPLANADIRAFLESRFKPHPIYGKHGKKQGLITGYYEPLLQGSLTTSARYAYPLYGPPADMLTIELESLYPQLKGMRLRGRIEGNKVVPFHSREAIDGYGKPLAGSEILWIDDPYGSFFLQIQGSGRVKLDDGTVIGVDYANQNGHPYTAIGKTLVQNGELPLEEVSLFTIKDWLRNNPERASEVLNTNPSYVFFTLREDSQESARGSLNVPLTAERSVAVDKNVIPLGTPVWLETTLPDGSSFQRLMLAQDTGGAIRGPVRADVFFGTGSRAEQLAGEMKQSGKLFALLPVDNESAR